MNRAMTHHLDGRPVTNADIIKAQAYINQLAAELKKARKARNAKRVN